MSEKPPSKDEALEALDFIVNVLKEHEKDLDRLISELGAVAGNFGDAGELSEKVAKVEGKIIELQNQVEILLKQLSPSLKQIHPKTALIVGEDQPQPSQISVQNGLAFVLQCKHWVDLQAMAAQARTVSFMYKESEKTLQVSALKNNQLLVYMGEMPNISMLLKTWLSKQLETPEKNILEGALTLN